MMKKILIILFGFLFTLSFITIGGRASSEQCSFLEESDIGGKDNRQTFDLDSTPMILNATNIGSFNYPYGKMYMSFVSTERQFIKLNYSGPMTKLKIYNYYYCNTNDYLFYSSQFSYDLDIIYCDAQQTYVLEFESNTYNLGSFTLYPVKVTSSNLTTHEKYFMHIEYDSTSSLGYRYDVEYKNIDLNNTTSTTEYINLDGGVTGYLDLISDTLNFKITNDARYLVSNPSELQYSAIAYVNSSFKYISSDSTTTNTYRGTGTFVDDTTVLSCAHLFYDMINNANSSFNGYTSIAHQAFFYPGANSYYSSTNWSQNFGTYKGIETYLPISYVLYDVPNINSNDEAFTNRIGFDWSITLTENIVEGIYTHSYMGMYTLTGNTHTQVQSAGYPALQVCPNNDLQQFSHTMWSSIPLFNTVEISNYSNYVFTSSTIRSTPGNSGGPVYVYVTTVFEGQVLRYSSTMGILDGFNTSSFGTIFNYAYICKIRPVIINLYYEVV